MNLQVLFKTIKQYLPASICLLAALLNQGLMLNAFLQQLWIDCAIYHLLSALLFPCAIWFTLADRFKQNHLLLLFLYLTCLSIPIVSGLSLCLISLIYCRFSKKPTPTNFKLFDPPTIPENIIHTLAYTQSQGNNIRAVLSAATAENLRIEAVLATRKMSDQLAIPILQIALLDPLDEVRLLAYSMLNSKEKKFSGDIQMNLTHLKKRNLSSKKKAFLQVQIAEAYWELAYLGLEQGQARIHVLEAALKYASRAAKVFQQDAELFFLQGRISLELGKYPAASQYFLQAEKHQIPAEKILPYQAELAFAEHRMHDVKTYIQSIQESEEQYTLTEMVNQWL